MPGTNLERIPEMGSIEGEKNFAQIFSGYHAALKPDNVWGENKVRLYGVFTTAKQVNTLKYFGLRLQNDEYYVNGI
jgi:hypothetical protein